MQSLYLPKFFSGTKKVAKMNTFVHPTHDYPTTSYDNSSRIIFSIKISIPFKLFENFPIIYTLRKNEISYMVLRNSNRIRKNTFFLSI